MKCEGELINMTRAWDKEKFWVPDRNRTHDLPNTLLSMSSRSSVDRAPVRFSGGHGSDSCRGLRIFLCPTLVSCWLIHLHIHATLGRSMSHRSIANCTPVNLNTLNTSISLNQIAFQSTKTVFGMTLSFIYRCIFYEYNLAPVTAWRGHWMLIVSTNFLWQSVAGCVITILR